MMQVYHRVQHLIRSLEPSFVFGPEKDLTECIALLTHSIDRHLESLPVAIPQYLAILSDVLAKQSNFTFADRADMFSVIMKAHTALSSYNMPFNEQILTSAILTLSSIEENMSSEWSYPVETKVAGGSCLFMQTLELRICGQVMSRVLDFCQRVGYKLARAYFQPVFRKHMQLSTDWRQKYGALMTAVHVGEEVEDISEVKIYIDAALLELRSIHPKIKYAALQLLGQFGETVRPIFQEIYFESVVPQLLKLLWDCIPRVSSHAFACLSNFLSEFHQYWRVEAIVNDLLPPLLHYLKSDALYMQRCALDVVCTVGGIRNCLGSHVGVLIQACSEVLLQSAQNLQGEMLEEVFDSLSLLLCNQNQKQVACLIPHFMQSLFANQASISNESFFECWMRLCQEYKFFVDLETTNLIPQILKKVEKMMQQEIDEIAFLALEGLSSTFRAFQKMLIPYAPQIYTFCKSKLQNKQYVFSVRNKALDLIVELLLATRPADHQDEHFLKEAMNLLQFLIAKGDQSISNEADTDLLLGVLGGILNLIEPLGPTLTHQAIISLSDRLIAYRQRIEELTKEEEAEDPAESTCQDSNDADSSFEDQDEETSEEANELISIIDLIPEIYTKMLVVSGPSDRQLLVNILIPQISFAVSKGNDWKQFALDLALALVEGCTYDDLSAYWGDLMTLFSGFMHHSQNQLRTLSVYGVGIIIEKTPPTLISAQNVSDWLQALWSSQAAPYDHDQQKNNILHCNDNIVAALGKLLNRCGGLFPHVLTSEVYQRWLQLLPLKQDQLQGEKQHEILLNMLNSNPSVLLSEANGLKRILEILSDYFLLHCSEKQNSTLLKSKVCFHSISQWDLFQRSSDFLWAGLSSSQRGALAKLMEYS